MPECPYHAKPKPCRDCLVKGMGEFAHKRPGKCLYHNNQNPCHVCFDNKMGAFAHAPTATLAPAYVAPALRPIHIHQRKKDTCAIACCAMVGANLDCPRGFTVEGLEQFMTEKGIYLPGDQSLFHALDRVFDWLGLRCRMRENVGLKEIAEMVKSGSLVVMEARGHVIVIFSRNIDGTFVIGDPAMWSVEMDADPNDYRLKGTGRVWEIRR